MYLRNVLPLNRACLSLAKSIPTEPKKKKPEPKWRCMLTREQILDMRAKYEFGHYTTKMIQEEFNLTQSQTWRYLNYLTQRDLVPKRPK